MLPRHTTASVRGAGDAPETATPGRTAPPQRRPERTVAQAKSGRSEVRHVEQTEQKIHPTDAAVKPKDEQDDKVEGKNAQHAAGVEALPVVGAGAGVKKDSRNEESGEHEEEVDSQPAGGGKQGQELHAGRDRDRRGKPPVEAVVEDHGKNRDAAKRIEPRHLALQQRTVEGVAGDGENSVVRSGGLSMPIDTVHSAELCHAPGCARGPADNEG